MVPRRSKRIKRSTTRALPLLPLRELLAGQDAPEIVLLMLDRLQLARLRMVSRDVRTWIEQLLLHIGLRIRLVDVLNGVHTRVLRGWSIRRWRARANIKDSSITPMG